MRILVTGHEGFTGRYLCSALTKRGHEVVGLNADITDRGAVRAAVANCRPESVVHLAALAFVNLADFDGYYQVNQIGTYNLLEALAATVPQIPVLLASSATVYGSNAQGVVSEEVQAAPVNHYGVSKWAMEMGARLWRGRLRITIARPFNYTGLGQDVQFLVPKIIEHFRRGESFIELGNIDVGREFGDVRSVAEVYARFALEPPPWDTLNICTGRVHTVREILEVAQRLTGHKIEVRVNPALVRSNDVPVLVGDPRRLIDAWPDWEPLPLEDTLNWMLKA